MKKSFTLTRGDMSTEDVEASPVVIFPWIETIVHKSLGYSKGWTVSEVTTGLSIKHGKTRKEAIENSRECLEAVGKERTQEQMRVMLAYIDRNR